MLAHRIFKAAFVTDVSPISGRGAATRRRRDRSPRRLSRLELPRPQGEGAAGGRRVVVGDRLSSQPAPLARHCG